MNSIWIHIYYAIIKMAVSIILYPIIYIVIGYLGGWVIKWCFGGIITTGMNSIWMANYYTPDMIPNICAVLALAGGYLSGLNHSNNPKESTY